MKPMSASQIAEAKSRLGFAAAATDEGVLTAINTIRHADRHRTDPIAVVQALGAAAALAWRLLDVETERVAFRSTAASLVAANRHGEDFGLNDLVYELERASIDLTDEIDEADDLARARAREGWL